MPDQETIRRAFLDHELPIVSYGLHFPEACRLHADTTFHASRIYIIASGTISRTTDNLKHLQEALGDKVVGTSIGMKPHTWFSEVLEVVHDARKDNVDLIITLGAGSLADGAKVISFALANDVETREDLITLPNVSRRPQRTDAKPSSIPIISIPTTLSGAEYSNYGGATDDATHVKWQFAPPLKGPSLIVLDPALTTTTPTEIWLSTGIRSVDHCIETLCSLQSDALSDKIAAEGLKRLAPGLLKSKLDPADLEGRHMCQIGVMDSLYHLTRGIHLGASHGIGHMLGPMGVGHGDTSCILMPAVAKYNAKANADRQQYCLEILWADDVVKSVLEKRGLKAATADLGDTLEGIVQELGMPTTLKDVGIGRDRLDELARNSLQDAFLLTNPVPITTKEQVLDILEHCVG